MPFTNLDTTKLFRQVIYGDGIAGNLLETIPVTPTGEDDPVRQRQYGGQTFFNTPQGQVNLTWQLKATTFEEALAEWIIGLEAEVDRMKGEAIKSRILSGVGARPRRNGG